MKKIDKIHYFSSLTDWTNWWFRSKTNCIDCENIFRWQTNTIFLPSAKLFVWTHQQVVCRWIEFNHSSKLYFPNQTFYEQTNQMAARQRRKNRETYLPIVLLFWRLCVPRIWSMLYRPFGFDWISLCDRILNDVKMYSFLNNLLFFVRLDRDLILINRIRIRIRP